MKLWKVAIWLACFAALLAYLDFVERRYEPDNKIEFFIAAYFMPGEFIVGRERGEVIYANLTKSANDFVAELVPEAARDWAVVEWLRGQEAPTVEQEGGVIDFNSLPD